MAEVAANHPTGSGEVVLADKRGVGEEIKSDDLSMRRSPPASTARDVIRIKLTPTRIPKVSYFGVTGQ